MKKRIFILVVCFGMLLNMLPISVLAKSEDTIILLDVSGGNISIDNGSASGTFKVSNGATVIDNIDVNSIFKITGTTTANSVTVNAKQSSPVKITLDGVNIDASASNYGSAFNINNTAGAVNITLADGSTNTLKSGLYQAGLQKKCNGEDTMLTVNGTGTLNATGGTCGAGVGSSMFEACSYITINGGTINATSGKYGAGIGSGLNYSCSNITINGGIINASSELGAGIGSGNAASCSNITINGGMVTANSIDYAGIGSASDEGSCSNITINGGTVSANSLFYSGISGGVKGSTSNVIITGGNIKSTISITPTKADGTTPVYKTVFTVRGATEGTAVDLLNISGYNTSGIKTQDTDKVYVYLPENATGTETTVSFGGKNYFSTVTTDNNAKFVLILISPITAPTTVKSGEKLALTAPSIKNPNNITYISQGWQIKKTDGNYETFDPSTFKMRTAYNNALIRYFVKYTDNIEITDYSNEVTTTVDIATGSVSNISDISKIYDGNMVSNPSFTTESKGTVTFEYKVKDADDSTYTVTKPSSVGNYTVRITVDSDSDYTKASATKDFSITYLDTSTNPYTINATKNSAGWYNSDVVITPESGYTISTSLNGTYTSTLTFTESVTDLKVYLKNELGQITDAITVGDFKIDKDAPTNVCVSYGKDDGFREFINTITFGLFFKERTQVILTASDNNSQVKEFKYTIDGTEHTIATSNGMVSFYIEPQFKGNISNIKAIDNAGNETVGKTTEYFAVDSENPVAPTVDLNGYTAGTWTYSDVKITLSGATATSGIAKYQYSIDNGANWIDITATEETAATTTEPYNAIKADLIINTDSNSVSYIFRAISNAGNIGQASDVVLTKVDKLAPTIDATGDIENYKQSDTISVATTAGISHMTKIEAKKDDGDYADITSSYAEGYSVSENGTYTFRITNGAGAIVTDSIIYTKIDSAKPVISIDSNGYTEDSWETKANITLNVSNATANLGTTTIQYKLDSGDWQNYTSPIIISQDIATATYTFKATSASGVVSDEKTFAFKRDVTAPDGDITIKENSVKKIINTISFGLFYKESIDISISSSDATSEVESVKYYRSDKILTQNELNEISTWNDYSAPITETVTDTEKFVYYVKITDKAGNVTIFGSDGITFDTTAPVISGIEDGKTYSSAKKIKIIDTSPVSVTINGNPVELENNKFSLKNLYGKLKIEVTDSVGYKTSMTITVNKEINNQDSGNATSPDTGDHNYMILWIALMLFSCGIIITLAIAGKHRKKYKN